MLTILIFGFLFGLILQYASLNKYNVISGMATLENLAVAKAIAMAVGVGMILLNIEIALGGASYHVKPLILGGVILGGIFFGIGMAILGYCPGTLAISLGEGSLDALFGILGGLSGGLLYTVFIPAISGVLGPDLGAVSLESIIQNKSIFWVLVLLLSALFIGVSFWLNKIERKPDYKWMFAGIALAVLNTLVFAGFATDRPIGASTMYPYLMDSLAGLTRNDYFQKIAQPGHWEMIFLSGAFLAGLVGSLLRKNFRLRMVYENWEKYKGPSKIKRGIWAFAAGFLLLFGARMAGGCTSGHVISGGMQLAFSSLLFAIIVFGSLVITGKLFYQKRVSSKIKNQIPGN